MSSWAGIFYTRLILFLIQKIDSIPAFPFYSRAEDTQLPKLNNNTVPVPSNSMTSGTWYLVPSFFETRESRQFSLNLGGPLSAA